jgi:SAM-dependent methyltransferase
LGLTNVDFAVTDAQQLELGDEQFDAAVCRWGYMLMGDPDEAMRRTRRVLREGGRLALATWDRPDRNLWLSAPVLALVGHGVMPPPNPADPSPFALPDPADLERRLRAAGFSETRSDKVDFSQLYPSFDEYWEEMMDMAAPIAEALRAVSPAEADAARDATRETLSQFTADDGRIDVPAVAVVATAVA